MSTVRQHRNARHLLLFAVLCSLVRFIFSRATLSLSLFFVLLVTLKDPEIQSVIWDRATFVIVALSQMTDWISGSFNVTSRTKKRDSERVALEKIKRTRLHKTAKSSRCRAFLCCLTVLM